MQCVSHFRDAYETAAWQLYLRECAVRTAREEVAFLESTGGATKEELDRIRQRVVSGEPLWPLEQAFVHPLVGPSKPEELDDYPRQHNDGNNLTVSLKSVLSDIIQSDSAINSLCRRVRPMLDQHGIPTFKKHHAVHVLRADAHRIRELGSGVV